MLRDHALLLERSGVLTLLIQKAERAASGSGQVVLLEAPAGMGKTTVLAALSPRLRDLGFQVLSARASEQEKVHAHGVTRSLLGPVVGSRGPSRVGGTGLLDAAAGPVRSLFEPGYTDEGPLLHALYWVVSNLSELGPVALVVDDAHTADAASAEFLSFLARRVEDLPVLLLVSARPSGQAAWEAALGALADEAQRVHLDPLSSAAVLALCAQVLGSADTEVVAACLSASGGNPFYLTELLAELQGVGVALTPDRIASTAPPAIIRSVLLRVGALPGGAADLARTVAVSASPTGSVAVRCPATTAAGAPLASRR